MIDMTLNPEDRAKFIRYVSVDDEKGCYLVTYADGKTVEDDCVNPHNDEVYVHRMRNQFLEYKNDYVNAIGKKCMRLYASRINGILLTVISLVIDYNLDIHIATKILIGLGIVGINFITSFINKLKIIYCDKVLEHIEVMEHLNNHMSDYYGKIEIEETGEIKEAQIINFNNVEAFSNIDSMNKMFDALVYQEPSTVKGK